MRMLTFAKRNMYEMLRDPLNVSMGLGFPIVVMLLLTAIQANIPVSLFELDRLTPGIALFGLSFVSLFSATLISKDRSTSYLMRLYASPLTPFEFIAGYVLPMLPIAVLQTVICFLVAFCLGLTPSIGVLVVIAELIVADVFFIALGLLFGAVFNDKQVGGICGALLTNLTAWLSGTWFDLEQVGGTFKTVADIFPFSHAVNAGRAAMAGNYAAIFPDMWWVIGYAVVTSVVAVLVFSNKMRADNM